MSPNAVPTRPKTTLAHADRPAPRVGVGETDSEQEHHHEADRVFAE
jgi:hypothetical protein